MPGRNIPVWFEATKAGKYEVPCAELCGFGHSGMKGFLYVDTPEAYAAWARENKVRSRRGPGLSPGTEEKHR